MKGEEIMLNQHALMSIQHHLGLDFIPTTNQKSTTEQVFSRQKNHTDTTKMTQVTKIKYTSHNTSSYCIFYL